MARRKIGGPNLQHHIIAMDGHQPSKWRWCFKCVTRPKLGYSPRSARRYELLVSVHLPICKLTKTNCCATNSHKHSSKRSTAPLEHPPVFQESDGDFPASDLLVETGGWLPTTVRIWVGDYGMLKPPRSCCCRSFGAVDLRRRGFSGFWGWYVVAVDFQCQKSNSKKMGRKTHPKDITVHAWMLLWFVWIKFFWGFGFSGIFSQDIFFQRERYVKHWPQEGHSRPVYGDSVARVVNEFPTVIWPQNDVSIRILAQVGNPHIYIYIEGLPPMPPTPNRGDSKVGCGRSKQWLGDGRQVSGILQPFCVDAQEKGVWDAHAKKQNPSRFCAQAIAKPQPEKCRNVAFGTH